MIETRRRIEHEAGADARIEVERDRGQDAELVAVPEQQHVTVGGVGPGQHAAGRGSPTSASVSPPGIAPVHTVQSPIRAPRARISAVVRPSNSP